MAERAGLYIHIPFCIRKCSYCDFYSVPVSDGLRDRFVSALKNQLRSISGYCYDTVYFGGGTPSLLAPTEVFGILEAAAERSDVEPDAEITLEMNPATAGRSELRELRAAGINRLSVGLQSVRDDTFGRIGRLHDAAMGLAALDDAASVFDNFSADVMLALPGEGAEDALATARAAVTHGASHVSAYLLKLMPGTPFGEHPPKGLPGDDASADIYEQTAQGLETLGLERYEISNFARPGRESRHNLKYWNCEDYVGAGPAAASSLKGIRFRAPDDLGCFCETYAKPGAAHDALWQREGAVTDEDYIMLRLRTADGLSLKALKARFGGVLSAQKLGLIKKYAEAKLLCFDGDRISLTTRGMLVSNAIISELI